MNPFSFTLQLSLLDFNYNFFLLFFIKITSTIKITTHAVLVGMDYVFPIHAFVGVFNYFGTMKSPMDIASICNNEAVIQL